MTNLQVLNRFPNDIRAKIARNVSLRYLPNRRNYSSWLKQTCDGETLGGFIFCAFIWADSPEGYKFWSDQWEKYRGVKI